jgi:hypothetical protein
VSVRACACVCVGVARHAAVGTIGHVAHGKSTVVKAISGVQVRRVAHMSRCVRACMCVCVCVSDCARGDGHRRCASRTSSSATLRSSWAMPTPRSCPQPLSPCRPWLTAATCTTYTHIDVPVQQPQVPPPWLLQVVRFGQGGQPAVRAVRRAHEADAVGRASLLPSAVRFPL